MKDLLTYWPVITSVVSVICVIAITVHMTRKNTSTIEALRLNEITDLYEKNNENKNALKDKIDEKEARKIFVTKELNDAQMKHLDNSINEIKEYQKEILGYFRKWV